MEFMHPLANSKRPRPTPTATRRRASSTRSAIVVVPIINVDGFVSSRGENASGHADPGPRGRAGLRRHRRADGGLGGTFAYRRKNCDGALPGRGRATTPRSVPCYYQYGVDPNRNYGFDWGGPGASTDPTTQTYRGTGQWSEPETQAVWQLLADPPGHHAGHACTRSPRSCCARPACTPTAWRRTRCCSRSSATRWPATPATSSQYGWELYDTTGTTEDWNYGAVGTLGYTIEIGPSGGVFHGDYKTAVEDQWTGSKLKIGGKTPTARRSPVAA